MLGTTTRKVLTVLAASVAISATTQAQPVLDSGWKTFRWLDYKMTDNNFSTFTLSSSSAFNIRIVDAGLPGDQFKLSWIGDGTNGSFLTSPSTFSDDPTYVNSGDEAWLHPELSKGSQIFEAGEYQFTFEVLEGPSLSVGYGFIEASTVVPEPSTWALMTAGLAGLFVAARKRRNAQQ